MATKIRKRRSRRRRQRSPGVMLRGRAAGHGHWDDEVDYDGGKKILRRYVRRIERHRFRRDLASGNV